MVHGKSYVGIVFNELFIIQLFGQKYRKIMNNCEYINRTISILRLFEYICHGKD